MSFLEENLSGAPPAGVSDEALTTVREIVAEMRRVHASEGIGGVTRYMADAVNDPRLEFDVMLKLASRRAILAGGGDVIWLTRILGGPSGLPATVRVHMSGQTVG